jgi:hypothetical protein
MEDKDGIQNNFKSVNVKMEAKYFFTLAKGQGQFYKLAWATSLS